jgi:hypothetical protein
MNDAGYNLGNRSHEYGLADRNHIIANHLVRRAASFSF